MYTTLEIERHHHVSTIWLNRPEIRNAFNDVMIAELIHAFIEEGNHPESRVILLRGRGKVFCAGADINWMKEVAMYSREQNIFESRQLSTCFHTIYNCPKPTLAIVHGAAMGGANGLLAACDFAFCETDTMFSFSEIKIGIIPACISPYVIKRIGEYAARELMLTGKKISGKDAADLKLINKSFANFHETESYLQATIQQLLSSGPNAIRQCKILIDTILNKSTLGEAVSITADMIADIRASTEGQEGMSAFLEKRKPNWIIE